MPLFLSRFDNQPKFYWDQPKISLLLGGIRFRQGLLLGRIGILGSSMQKGAAKKGDGMEGGVRDGGRGQIVPAVKGKSVGHVKNAQDAQPGDKRILTEERLLEWHGGSWRNTVPAGIRAVHASSPQTPVLRSEIRKFLHWFNADGETDPVLKAAIAYYWFLLISPFEQGNEAVAAWIADLQLCRADGCDSRHYDVCGQLRERGTRGTIPEELMTTRGGETDITVWLEYFLEGMSCALAEAEEGIAVMVKRARSTDRYSGLPLNDRQQLVIQKLLGDEIKEQGRETAGLCRISTSYWATLAGCSQDTALRDIQDLMDRNILVREAAGGRSTQYILKERMS